MVLLRLNKTNFCTNSLGMDMVLIVILKSMIRFLTLLPNIIESNHQKAKKTQLTVKTGSKLPHNVQLRHHINNYIPPKLLKVHTYSLGDIERLFLVDDSYTTISGFISRQEVGGESCLLQLFDRYLVVCTLSLLYTEHISRFLLYVIQAAFL